MELGKVPPHDIEAEQAILGCMLTDKDSVISAIEVLKEEDFYREDNKTIYSAIVSLYAKNEPIDIITVKAELIEQGTFERVGGLAYLAELPEKVPTTANVDKYIKIVEEKSLTRHLIKSANELIALGYDETEEVTSIMDMAEKKIFSLSEKKSNKGYAAIRDVLVSTFAELEKLSNQKGKITGISTGFADLDHKTAGLHNSDLLIIAARPAMGKSAFAINLATNAAVKSNVPVVIFNLEMSNSFSSVWLIHNSKNLPLLNTLLINFLSSRIFVSLNLKSFPVPFPRRREKRRASAPYFSIISIGSTPLFEDLLIFLPSAPKIKP